MADQIAVLAALDEPARRRLYEAVRAANRPITREEAARATGISRKLAAFHLDKLVAVGLLATAEPVGPRQVGRAPKAYEPVRDAVQASVPARNFADLASILLDGIGAQRRDETTLAASMRIATSRGESIGRSVGRRRNTAPDGPNEAVARVRVALGDVGYEPYDAPDGALGLRNCPFHPLAVDHRDFVCAINGAFLSGLLAGARAEGLAVVPRVPRTQCCAEIRPRVRDNGAHE